VLAAVKKQEYSERERVDGEKAPDNIDDGVGAATNRPPE
jgi:hypothetical protein